MAELEDRSIDLAHIKELLQTDFLETYHMMHKEDQRRLWRSLIDEIYVEGTKITGIKPRFFSFVCTQWSRSAG